MEGTPTARTPGPDTPESAGEKITAAFALLASAFDDTRRDSVTVGKQELLTQIADTQHVLNATWAVQAARLAQVAAIEDVRLPDHTSPTGFEDREVTHPIGTHQDEFIGCEIGPLLGWTSGQAVDRVSEAVDFITRTPRLFARVGTGEIDPAKVTTIHRAIGRTAKELGDDGDPVTIDLARTVQSALLGDVDPEDDSAEAAAVVQEHVDVIAAQSTGRLRQRTERILRTLDPVAATKAATRRRRDRVGVFAHPDDEAGLTHVHAILESPAAAELMTAIDQLARDLHADTTTNKTLAECRADALADLVLSNASVATELVIQVPVHTGSGSGSGSGSEESSGVGHFGQRPGTFVHPITGRAVSPKGRPTPAGAGARPPGTSTGLRVKPQHEVDAEFNDLLKTLYPPDPEHDPPEGCDDDDEPIGREFADDRPPASVPAAPGRRPEPLDSPPASVPAAPGRRPEPLDRPPASVVCPPASVVCAPVQSPMRRERPLAGSAARLGDAVVPGVGIIPAAVVETMTRSFGATITRALVDADTGMTVETCETQYKPSGRLASFIRARDVHCRFPNCARPAGWCDIDHVTAWPHGPTAAWNLQLLCRHHHRTKQEQRWSVTMTRDGVCTWTSPSGRAYTTHPGE